MSQHERWAVFYRSRTGWVSLDRPTQPEAALAALEKRTQKLEVVGPVRLPAECDCMTTVMTVLEDWF